MWLEPAYPTAVVAPRRLWCIGERDGTKDAFVRKQKDAMFICQRTLRCSRKEGASSCRRRIGTEKSELEPFREWTISLTSRVFSAPPPWRTSSRNCGNANGRNTRCNCSASIPEPCTRLVSRRLSFTLVRYFSRSRSPDAGPSRNGPRVSPDDLPILLIPRPLDGCTLVSCSIRSWLESHSSSDRDALVGLLQRELVNANNFLVMSQWDVDRRRRKANREASPSRWKRPLSAWLFFCIYFRYRSDDSFDFMFQFLMLLRIV